MKPKKMGIIGGSMFSFGLFFLTFTFPVILRSQVKKQISLGKQGSKMREIWSNLPVPMEFRVHLFNVTNPVEITAGQTPILQEVGPYHYDQYKEKVDQVERDEDDSIEYRVKTTWYFNPELSNGLTGDEELIMPNLLALMTLKFVLKEQPGAIGVANKGVDSIFKKPKTIFMKVKAKDILFDGMAIDCNVKDFAGSTICGVLKERKDLLPGGENIYLLSLFGTKNGTVDPGRIRVLRGRKNFKDVGRVIEYDGLPALTIYDGEHCNAFNGTDSTIFPSLMTREDDIVSFSPEICRSISIPYRYDSKVKGVNTYHYSTDYGDMKSNPEEQCYCPTPDTCLDKDLMDLEKCVGVPMIGSQPHFLGAEEKYLEMVHGLHPDPELHDLSMDFDPLTATPIKAHKRLQFNMFLGPVEKFKLMKTFPECLFPIFWVDEGILLDGALLNQVKQVYMLLGVVGVLKYLMMAGGAGLGAAAGYFHYKNRDKNSMDVTKVTPESRNGKDEEKKWPPQQQMNISTIHTQSAAVPPNLDAN
ncbi:sensory neuron membrane protein 1 isoform X2 [Halictus rubicundus]